MNACEMLEVLRADALPKSDEKYAWLVDQLWGKQAVGMLAGHPKSGKSWLGLDMALSVASATPCLGRFGVDAAATVLIYLAEDSLPQVRKRLECITAHRKLRLEKLPLWVISASSLRLDCDKDCQRLEKTIQKLRPALLLLDPLVRMHQRDENDAMAIAALLSYLRGLQRRYRLAVMMVHHARKNGGAGGLALRGSSDLWAWGDSNLYLKKTHGKLVLNVEQRCAKQIEPIALRLESDDSEKVHLEAHGQPHTQHATTDDDLLERLRKVLAATPMTRTQLRAVLGIKNERLGALLAESATAGHIKHTKKGWCSATVRETRRRPKKKKSRDEVECSLFPL